MTATTQLTPHRFYSAQEIAQMRGGKQTGKGEYQCKCPVHDDRVASLSVGTGRNGDTLIDCKAGCDKRDVVKALGLEWRNLFREPRSNSQSSPYRPPPATPRPTVTVVPSPPKQVKPSRLEDLSHPTLGKPDAVYPYVNLDGVLTYATARFSKPEKSFRQAQPDGNGGWKWNLSGIEALPYRLPELIEAVSEERLIWIPEGEKDVERLVSAGLPATCNSGGAEKFPASAAKYFAGAHVAIIPDNDPPGRNHAEAVAILLQPVAASVKIVALPDLPEKGDVSDFLDRGRAVEDLLTITERTPRWPQLSGGELPAENVSKPRISLTDDEELMALEDPTWLNEGRIPRGATVQIFGGSGTFKSFVVVDLACHIAIGMDWQGRRVSQGAVVYICAEGVYGMKHRVAAWKKYHRVEGKLGLYFLRHGIGLRPGTADVNELLAEIRSRVIPPPVLIVVDTLARNLEGNENATEDMNAYVKGCDQLREATGATVLSVHHTGWTETDRARGASSNRGAMDTDILCTRDGDRVTLTNTKQKDAAEFAPISFEAISIGKSLVLKPMDQKGGKLDGNRLLCLRALHGMDDGATHGQWKKEAEMEKKNSSFSAARNWLLDSGYVRHAADKKYVVTDAGRMALSPQSIASPHLVHSPQVSVGPSSGGLLRPRVDQDPVLPFPSEAA